MQQVPGIRGLHSFTVQLNVSAFCGIGGIVGDYLGGVYEVRTRCRRVLGGVGGILCVRNGFG